MRLIDADKLILHLNDYALTEAPDERESEGERRISSAVYSAIQCCMKAVEEQPTAFDTDKIIDQLEELKGEDICKNMSCLLCKYTSQCETGEMGEKVAIDRAIEIVNEAEQLEQKNHWILVTERLPEPDKLILVSFKNCSFPMIGRYTVDGDGGGTFRIGDEDESFIEHDLYVNAWMPLPECYKEEKENG